MNILYVIVIASSVAGGGYLYYKDTQQRIETLTSNLSSYKIALETAQASLSTVRDEMQRQQESNAELQVSLSASETRLNALRSKFSEHDLTKLALARPGLIETRINNGTKQVFQEIETLTNPIVDVVDDDPADSVHEAGTASNN